MEVVVQYPDLESGLRAATRIDSIFDKDTLTGFNILIDREDRVTFGLVFDAPEHQPDPELIKAALEGGTILSKDLQVILYSGMSWKMAFLGDGYWPFRLYLRLARNVTPSAEFSPFPRLQD